MDPNGPCQKRSTRFPIKTLVCNLQYGLFKTISIKEKSFLVISASKRLEAYLQYIIVERLCKFFGVLE